MEKLDMVLIIGARVGEKKNLEPLLPHLFSMLGSFAVGQPFKYINKSVLIPL